MRKMMTPRLYAVALALTGMSFSHAVADTINVPADQATIAAAINASVNGDVIQIAAGTYNEHSLDTNGKAITIRGTLDASGARLTTINAQQNGRIFIINSGEGTNTLIQDLLLTGGGGPSASPGGAIYCYGTTPTISSCTISGNTTPGPGGGIFLENSNPIITNCAITGNTSTLQGGGIASINSAPIITSNTASNGGGGGLYQQLGCYSPFNDDPFGDPQGAVVFNQGAVASIPTLVGCTFSGNVPTQIQTGAGSDCTLTSNTSTCSADLNGDSVVDGRDLAIVLGAWGLPCGTGVGGGG